jgi:hypothetical protein
MIEKTGWLGEYEIITTHQNGTVTTEKLKNRIMNAGLNFLRDALKGDVTDAQIKYLAVGTSSIAVSDSQTQLGAEGFRTPFISKESAGTGVLSSTALILDNEAVFHIREVGIFAGVSATTASNSGVMISRILYDKDKTNLESIQFQRTDTIGRG